MASAMQTPRMSHSGGDTGMNRQPTERAVNTNDELAKAINRLSITNEAVMLPKSEILKFDGSARNFQRFLDRKSVV